MAAKEYDRKNPAFRSAHTGVATNHSSATPSLPNGEEVHEQADDQLSDIGPPEDPNISGNKPTRDCYTFQAGQLDGWCENDDYRTYFEQSRGCNGMLACDPNDGDYDDNGGHPTALGHSYGDHSDGSFDIGPVIMRRI